MLSSGQKCLKWRELVSILENCNGFYLENTFMVSSLDHSICPRLVKNLTGSFTSGEERLCQPLDRPLGGPLWHWSWSPFTASPSGTPFNYSSLWSHVELRIVKNQMASVTRCNHLKLCVVVSHFFQSQESKLNLTVNQILVRSLIGQELQTPFKWHFTFNSFSAAVA